VLARLGELHGVDSCSANESGTLICLSLRPGADPERVAAEASRALRGKTGDRVGVVLRGDSAIAALRQETWHGQSQVSEETRAAQTQARARSRSALLALILALILVDTAIGLWIVWLLRRQHCQAQSERNEPRTPNVSQRKPGQAA
jgi:hypothetical protein